MKCTLVAGLSMALSLLMSCGDAPRSTRVASNQETVSALSHFMEAHPEVSRANLKDIKDASGGLSIRGALSRQTTVTVGLNSALASEAPVEDAPESENVIPETPNTLDPEIAKKAQTLIDKALEDFDFMQEIEAMFKTTAISFNEINQMPGELNSIDKGGDLGLDKSDLFGDEAKLSKSAPAGGFGKGLPQGEKAMPTCKEFLENPYVRFAQKAIKQSVAHNKTAIKAKLSGCATILGQEFAQCLSDYNEYFTMINQHASCDMKGIEDFSKVMNEKTQGKFNEVEQRLARCTNEQFKACGFEQEKLEGSNPSNNRPHTPTPSTVNP